jgi:UDP-2,3-diacylglucosamine pyrophosphatase LpxH
MEKAKQARRVIVISDLHLGGYTSAMMSRPGRLARFLEELPAHLEDDEQLELVIAGDFVDFLTLAPLSSWTIDPQQAGEKIDGIMRQCSAFAPIFDALYKLVQSGGLLTILLGNHDLEMALPIVQEKLMHRLSAGPHQVLFQSDGRAYRRGGVLIEHGNRYDGANANDWEYLRLIASAQSRSEIAPVELRVSFGSQFVIDHVNPLKVHYPFLDLIQPQNELVALLLLAFEPELIFDWKRICAGLWAQRLQATNSTGRQPGKSYQIASSPIDQPNEELRNLFGPEYMLLMSPTADVGVRALLQTYLSNRKESIREILSRGDPIPTDRQKKIRAVMRELLLNDGSARLNGQTGPYGKAAERLLRDNAEIEAVVMGHTHLAREVHYDHGIYINSGTWIDNIVVPDDVITDESGQSLNTFLQNLLFDIRPLRPATYADIRVESDGHLAAVGLRSYHERL